MSTNVTVTRVKRLDAQRIKQIEALEEAATTTDGVEALNEASHFALERLLAPADAPNVPDVWVATDAADSVLGVLVDAAADGSGADVVVSPARRREGIGSALVNAYVQAHPDADEAPAIWAHGDLEPAQRFLSASGFEPVRSLWKMSRPLTADEQFDVTLPDGFIARPFDGSEAQAVAWLEVNALSFAYHPEQGRMTMDDFRERENEEWFDPEGLILVWDVTGPTAVLAASHWVKVEPGSTDGEVYVVAVAPAYQGRGLARPLTALGLRRLQAMGATTVDLYVEGDNDPAKSTYFRAGFSQTAHDAMYRLVTHGKSSTPA